MKGFLQLFARSLPTFLLIAGIAALADPAGTPRSRSTVVRPAVDGIAINPSRVDSSVGNFTFVDGGIGQFSTGVKVTGGAGVRLSIATSGCIDFAGSPLGAACDSSYTLTYDGTTLYTRNATVPRFVLQDGNGDSWCAIGNLYAAKGLVLNNSYYAGEGWAGAEPTCNAAARGTLWYTPGAGGVPDKMQVCAKSTLDAYAWRSMATIP